MRAGLFPGQGVDATKVAAALPAAHPLVEAASSILGYDLERSVESVARRPRPVLPTEVAQPAILVAGLISFDTRRDNGETFDCLVGHSLGEYTALVAGESITFAQGVALVAARCAAMKRAALTHSGGMIAVRGITPPAAHEIAEQFGCVVANDNSPSQVVLSGQTAVLSGVAADVRARGGRAILLPLEGAFHSPAMEPAVEGLVEALDRTAIRVPAIPVLSNVSAAPYRAPGEIRRFLARQLTERVRFRECIEWCSATGVVEFSDLGPGRVVGKLAESIVSSGDLMRA